MRSFSAWRSRSRSWSSAVLGVEPRAALGVEEVRDDADDARGVEDVDDRLRVRGRDAHRRVLARRRRAADQQRQVEAAPLHLARDVDHLVERRRDQAGQADEVRALRGGGVEDLLGRHHHAEVDHLVVVAAEDDADDVLADVVDVALHRREHRLPARARRGRRRPARPPCTARGRRRRASSRARSSRPAGGTSSPRRTGRRRPACPT